MSPGKVSTVDFRVFNNIVDGKPRSAKSFHQSICPATGEKLWEVPIATQQDVDDAVAAASRAFKTWSKTTLEERRKCLAHFKELFEAHYDDFLDLLIHENGKPVPMADGELKDVSRWSAFNQTVDLTAEVEDLPDRVIKTYFKPIGVCAGICPWNFPLLLSIGKIAPAITAGNAMIIKPSPYTPYTTLKMIEIMQEAYPPGVIQVVGGNDALGPMLTAHPDIQKISFTGSIPTGKKIMEACAKTLKRVSLELGGNDACIVMPDVNIQEVAPKVALGAFANSGQICVATKRIFIHESIYREFVDAMAAFAKTLKVGEGHGKDIMIGPINNKMQYDKVVDYFEDTKKNGYKFAFGSADIPQGKGYFINPAIVDNPPAGSRIVDEEPFGPIVPTQPWSDLEEVLDRANNTITGLGACIWSGDQKKAEEIAERLEAGTVWVNSFANPSPAGFFSGIKSSGMGGEWGRRGFIGYTQPRVVHTFK